MSEMFRTYGISSYDSNAMKSSNPHSGIYEASTARTLDLNGGNPACNQGGVLILHKKPVIRGGKTSASLAALKVTDADHRTKDLD